MTVKLSAAWRQRWWRWTVPLALVLVNLTILLVHPGRTGAGFADVERALEAESRELQALSAKQEALELVLADARASRLAVDRLYREGFATEAERLTQLIAEVKRLAQRAGLEPAAISYPEETIDEHGLVRMSLVFAVQGTYSQLRTLINLIELSDLFLVLERVGLRDSSASVLGINLQISTYFARDPDLSAPQGRRAAAARSSS